MPARSFVTGYSLRCRSAEFVLQDEELIWSTVPVDVNAVEVIGSHEADQRFKEGILRRFRFSKIGEGCSGWTRIVHGPASDSDPHLEIRLARLQSGYVSIQRCCVLVHWSDAKSLGIDQRKCIVDVSVVS